MVKFITIDESIITSRIKPLSESKCNEKKKN